MTEEEFNTAIVVVRNKYQSRISIAKSFMTEEQWKIFRSKPFIRERQDKPRAFLEHTAGSARCLGKVDWTYYSRVSMAQILRILNHDYTPRVREVQPRKGYVFVRDRQDIVI
jgi:hypothetical protein